MYFVCYKSCCFLQTPLIYIFTHHGKESVNIEPECDAYCVLFSNTFRSAWVSIDILERYNLENFVEEFWSTRVSVCAARPRYLDNEILTWKSTSCRHKGCARFTARPLLKSFCEGRMVFTRNFIPEKPSFVSKVLRVLITINLLPVKLHWTNRKISHNFCSKQTACFLFYNVILMLFSLVCFYNYGIFNIYNWFVFYYEKSNIIDFLSVFMTAFIVNWVVVNIYYFSHQVTHISSDIVLSPCLVWPDHGRKVT